jgi:hypothetical protein
LFWKEITGKIRKKAEKSPVKKEKKRTKMHQGGLELSCPSFANIFSILLHFRLSARVAIRPIVG